MIVAKYFYSLLCVSEGGSSRELTDEGMYVLRKKEEDQCLFGGITRSKPNKRSKRDKRKSFVSEILLF